MNLKINLKVTQVWSCSNLVSTNNILSVYEAQLADPT